MNELKVVEYKSERIITTELLAEAYETDVKNIQMNFSRNKENFVSGKHYYLLEGDELKDFKNQVTNSGLVPKNASHLYLWTERGANRHCKILDTDKSWEQFDNLEETYFKAKEMQIQKTDDEIILIGYGKALEKIKSLQLDVKIKDQLIGEMKPKADYTDKILKSKSTMNINAIAKDYGMSARGMNKILHELGVQYYQDGQWLLYAKHQGKGYTHSQTIDFERKDGTPDTRLHTQWTQKGRLFIYELLKTQKGILPLIEQ